MQDLAFVVPLITLVIFSLCLWTLPFSNEGIYLQEIGDVNGIHQIPYRVYKTGRGKPWGAPFLRSARTRHCSMRPDTGQRRTSKTNALRVGFSLHRKSGRDSFKCRSYSLMTRIANVWELSFRDQSVCLWVWLSYLYYLSRSNFLFPWPSQWS